MDISDSSKFGVISEVAEGELCPIIQIIKNVKQDWTKYWSLEYTASHWSPTCLCATDHDPLGLFVLPKLILKFFWGFFCTSLPTYTAHSPSAFL